MSTCYPLSRDDQRSYPDGFDGKVFVWDIDKTYLATRFSSLSGMARIPIEFAIDKQAIPGMPEILRGIRRGPGPGFELAPLYFISASPPQMRKVVERKMVMDGVEYDGIIFKDWLGCLARFRPGRLKEQLGFKLCALLTGRQNRPGSREYLFGDDVESDADAYYFYQRLLSGDLSLDQAPKELEQAGVKKDDLACIIELYRSLGEMKGVVEKSYIHLEKGTPTKHFDKYGENLVAVKGACQLALCLYQQDLINQETVQYVIEAVRPVSQEKKLASLIADVSKRGLISEEKLEKLGLG